MAKEKNKKKKAGFLWWLILIIAIGVFTFSGYQLITLWLEYQEGVNEYKDLRQFAEIKPPNEEDKEVIEGEDPGPQIDFASLKAINEDVIGWLYIEGLEEINYPIAQGKDNDFYLHRTFEGTYNFAGSIFLDYENKKDFTDCNSIVYGHNMKNGSMFGQLKKFREAETYGKSMYFWICTPERNYKYEIISAQEVVTGGEAYTLFPQPSDEFVAYMEKMKGQSEIPIPDMTFSKKDKIVTLSTCTTTSSNRFIVQGRQVQ